MKEDYVSFETAKLLKEQGFNVECKSFYYDNGKFDTRQVVLNFNKSESCFTAPTLYIAQKWLREEKDIHITINVHEYTYCATLWKTNGTFIKICITMGPNIEGVWNSYEEALDYGIYKSLKLIQTPNKNAKN